MYVFRDTDELASALDHDAEGSERAAACADTQRGELVHSTRAKALRDAADMVRTAWIESEDGSRYTTSQAAS